MAGDHKYSRVEFDWLATDLDGFVLYLSSAGAGPVPDDAIARGEVLENLQERIGSLSVAGESILVSDKANPPDWIEAAKRGFFAYDWSYDNRRYELVARPTRPIRAADLDDRELREIAESIRIPVRALSGVAVTPELLLQ